MAYKQPDLFEVRRTEDFKPKAILQSPFYPSIHPCLSLSLSLSCFPFPSLPPSLSSRDLIENMHDLPFSLPLRAEDGLPPSLGRSLPRARNSVSALAPTSREGWRCARGGAAAEFLYSARETDVLTMRDGGGGFFAMNIASPPSLPFLISFAAW